MILFMHVAYAHWLSMLKQLCLMIASIRWSNSICIFSYPKTFYFSMHICMIMMSLLSFSSLYTSFHIICYFMKFRGHIWACSCSKCEDWRPRCLWEGFLSAEILLYWCTVNAEFKHWFFDFFFNSIKNKNISWGIPFNVSQLIL